MIRIKYTCVKVCLQSQTKTGIWEVVASFFQYRDVLLVFCIDYTTKLSSDLNYKLQCREHDYFISPNQSS